MEHNNEAECNSLGFAVFSFNRGQFLDNCIRSIEHAAPGMPISVYDDNSTDDATLRVLDSLAKAHTIIVPDTEHLSKHGGLSANMQQAIDEAPANRILCCIQDDMQLVRSINSIDLQAITACFESDPLIAFVHPVFLKGCNRHRDIAATRYAENTHTYIRTQQRRSAGIHYADVMITLPSRLREAGWKFCARERDNEVQARQLFTTMHFLFDPFVMWLPSVPVFRDKRRTLALRMGERRHRSGFHPLRTLDGNEVKRLRKRLSTVLPVAEDWLVIDGERLPEPWVYDPLHGRRWLKWLNRLELSLCSDR